MQIFLELLLDAPLEGFSAAPFSAFRPATSSGKGFLHAEDGQEAIGPYLHQQLFVNHEPE